MKKFIVAILALLALQMIASPTPEEMYGSLDKDGKYRQMQEQVDQMIQKNEEAAQDKAAKQQIALWVAQALAIGLAGAAVLFGLNYGIFLLKIEYGSKFNAALAAALVLLLTIGAIYMVKKK